MLKEGNTASVVFKPASIRRGGGHFEGTPCRNALYSKNVLQCGYLLGQGGGVQRHHDTPRLRPPTVASVIRVFFTTTLEHHRQHSSMYPLYTNVALSGRIRHLSQTTVPWSWTPFEMTTPTPLPPRANRVVLVAYR